MRKYLLIAIMLICSAEIPLNSQDTIKIKSEYLPVIDGILKTKVEYDLDNSRIRFEVRNARLAVLGKINDFMSYKAGLDLNNEGKMQTLDAYIRLTPIQNFDIYLGQKKIPFSSDYLRNPIENIFANHSFLSKYINEGMRDIGLFIDYKFTGKIPIDLLIGAVNGTGENNPQWTDKPNLVNRIIIGPDNGFRIAGNLYLGEREYHDKLSMFGGEVRYSNGPWFIESEYIRRNWTDTISLRRHDDGLYIHTYYNFHVNKKMIQLLTPTARWDFIGDSVFGNEVDASRITLGINLGYEAKQFYSEVRLNYEYYFKSSLPDQTDKLTLEFVGRF